MAHTSVGRVCAKQCALYYMNSVPRYGPKDTHRVVIAVVVVVVYILNCNRHTADKYIFHGVQFVAVPSELYSCHL